MTETNSSRRPGSLNAARIIGGAIILTLPIALFAPKGIAPLFGITALLVLGLTFNQYKSLSVLPLPLSVAIAAFIGFAAVSSLWSVTPGETLYSALVLAMTAIGGLAIILAASRFTAAERTFVEKAAIIGGAFGFVLILFEFTSDGALKQIMLEAFFDGNSQGKSYDPAVNPGLVVYLLFFWPLAVALKRRLGFLAMILALAAIVVTVLMGRANSPLLALGLGLAIAVAALASSRLTAVLCASIVIIGIVAMPYLPGFLPNPHTETHRLSYLSKSALHRLSIWSTAADRLTERPLLGFGMNSTRSLYSSKDKIIRQYFVNDPDKKWHNLFEPIPLHVHNGILQIWLELGIGGAVLLAAIFLSLIKLIRDNSQNLIWTAASFGLLISAIVIFSVSFGPWQSWWQATLWLSAGFMAAVRENDDQLT